MKKDVSLIRHLVSFLLSQLEKVCILMKKKAFKPYATFTANDGRKIVLRSIRWEDLDDCLEFINSLVEEDANILRDTKVSRWEEAEWLGTRLARVENGALIDIVVEVDGKVVANSEVEKRSGLMSHVGSVGIAIRSGYRGIGIGTKIMQALIDKSRKAGLKILVLDVFDINQAAKALYKKMGFREAGRIPKGIHKNGKYFDLIRMTREL
jgi:L-amino acid N-acyltransferase YncA